ncbi:fibronectin type III domain-containing protein [Actinoplanes sp. NPDC051859]|uniref:fibronectin type III domain-containing protein n=1 Tax=Actinoplanes sp. NPDC051859 TaxID=3363909 RepID=UPI0037A87D95
MEKRNISARCGGLGLLVVGMVAATTMVPTVAAAGPLNTRNAVVIAGDGNYSTVPGPALSSGFYYASQIAADNAGNVFVSAGYEYVVDKIDADGNLTVLAGQIGNSGQPTDGALATSTELSSPESITTDQAGNVYIADYGARRILKVDTAGVLHFVVGSGSSQSWTPIVSGGAALSTAIEPLEVAVGADGAIYGATSEQVFKVVNGTLTVIAGSGANGAPTVGDAMTSTFANIKSLAVDAAGNVYIGDSNAVLLLDQNASTLSLVAGTIGAGGTPANGLASASSLGDVQQMAVDTAGDLYLADDGARRAMKITDPTSGTGQLLIFAGTGAYSSTITTGVATSLAFGEITGIAVRGTSNIYFSSESWNAVLSLVPDVPDAPVNLTAVPGPGYAALQFRAPVDDGGAAITGYEFSTNGGSTWTALNYSGGPVYDASVALTAGSQYSVQVRARNSAGPGASSTSAPVTPNAPPVVTPTPTPTTPAPSTPAPTTPPPTTAPPTTTPPTTPPDEPQLLPPDAPIELTGTGSDDSLALSFGRPNDNGSPITRYEAAWTGSDGWQTLPTRGGVTRSATLTDLLGGRPYRVLVRAVNAAGAGPASEAVTIETRTWFADPVPVSARAAEVAVPARPESYKGKRAFTKARYRAYNNQLTYPITRLAGRPLAPRQAGVLSGNGLFEFDSAVLTAEGRRQVRLLVPALAQASAIRCEGYTDYGADLSHEYALSRARSRTVCAALRAAGADVTYTTRGYGPQRPVVVGGSRESRAENRRVIVLVLR